MALADRLELRVVHHHCGEERGQVCFMSVVSCMHPATTADPLERTTFVATFSTRRSLGVRYTPARKRKRRSGKPCFTSHSPQVGELDVLKRLSEVNERRSGRTTHRSGEFACQSSRSRICAPRWT